MKIAIVTGAQGFVGRHLIPELLKLGYFVEALDILPAAETQLYEWDSDIENFPNEDAANPDWHDYFCKRHENEKVDLFVHLAANIVNVANRMSAGIEAYSDIVLDYNVCKWVEKLKPKCFIAMSSCAVDYPADPYCIVKRNLEALATTLHKNGQRTVILRPFSGYGIDQSDEYPFPSIMKRAYKREDPLTVWGGLQERDWLHVSDLVAGIIHGIHNFPSGYPIELGTQKSISFKKLADLMAQQVGYNPKIIGDETKPSSSMLRRAGLSDTALPGQTYGWFPKVSIEEGIKLEYSKLLGNVT